jgi:adenylate cyclase
VLRVTAQLVDALNGRELWANKFDQVVAGPFAVQDDITRAICAQLEPQMRLDDIAYGNRSGSVQSWRLWQEGWYDLFVDAPMPVPVRSLELFRKALALDPDYPLAHAGIAIALSTGMLWGGISPEEFPVIRHHAEWAYKHLPENPAVLYAMAMWSFVQPIKMSVALEYVSKAVDLEPSNPLYRAVRGYLVANLGDAKAGLEECLRAMRLSPKDSREPFICYMLGNAYIADGQYDLAIDTMTRCRQFSVVDFIWIMLAFSHMQLGDTQSAMECLSSIENPRPLQFYKWSIRERLWLTVPSADKERFLAMLSSVIARELPVA